MFRITFVSKLRTSVCGEAHVCACVRTYVPRFFMRLPTTHGPTVIRQYDNVAPGIGGRNTQSTPFRVMYVCALLRVSACQCACGWIWVTFVSERMSSPQ